MLTAALLAGLLFQDPLEEQVQEMLAELERARQENVNVVERMGRLAPEVVAELARRAVAERYGGIVPEAVEAALVQLDERSWIEVVAAVSMDARQTTEARLHAALLLARAGDFRSFESPAWIQAAIVNGALPAEARLAAAERLAARGQLQPVEDVLAALAGIRGSSVGLVPRIDALRARLGGRTEAGNPGVAEVPRPLRTAPPPAAPAAGSDPGDAARTNWLIGAGALALAALLLATRRRT